MKVTTVRWLLAPISSWRARRLQRTFTGGLPLETAWQLVRLRYHMDEVPYIHDAMKRHMENGGGARDSDHEP
ncbi:hypothetical protein ACIQ9P_37980 [Kitasatospora sp. NPDC094019]|uniref:hypothetical protein n=1 Tax=Kitasatospora sp. NPDC094019 TaxID=3364091 RepID=UPI0038293FE5